MKIKQRLDIPKGQDYAIALPVLMIEVTGIQRCTQDRTGLIKVHLLDGSVLSKICNDWDLPEIWNGKDAISSLIKLAHFMKGK